MHTIKNISLLSLLIFATTHTIRSMDQAKPEKKVTTTQKFNRLASITVNILLGNVPVKTLYVQESGFALLPQEEQTQIILALVMNSDATSLSVAARAINTLSKVNKSLNQVINNPVMCLNLIQYLSHRFNSDNETVCSMLQTQESKRLLNLQFDLRYLCNQKNPSLEKLNNLHEQGASLEFTYKGAMTPLLLAIGNNNLKLMQAILEKGANPNQTAPGSMTPLVFCITLRNFQGIKMLINAGADPELADDDGITPLRTTMILNDDQIHTFIVNTIQMNKKYPKKERSR